ncbi:hypothetical protein AB7813_00095 [Tardiphaga sp. 20_F10_N6_6]|uniref:hypothetical protein n=1 Tax=Tardiphaga sp. 20_F10_N6_6 TaxID=3240788 RepID=UPI003F8BF49C
MFADQEPTSEIGIAGMVAARPNDLPLETLNSWLAILRKAIEADQHEIAVAMLKDTVPEYRAAAQ